MTDPARLRALTIGLHPRALDYSRLPDLDEEQLTARVDAANAALRDTEFDITPCLVSASPDEAENDIRAVLATRSFDLVMVGGAVRAIPEHTLLFERVVNLLAEAAPGIRFCFNTSPETTLDALRRAAAFA
ncbi:hypothetical protein A5780_21250 [Nocardia sp. 852002-20019_SCH5090214]|jgi:hypothetical protein|uniref:hypothetical protein n=1 Tax=Nocardia TaxID=1817 RepID=UPI0004C2D1CA|nr:MULTISPECIES: hypothetical protein [Nocardia]MBF6148539.1 hypothetical protein [Nocardia nova]MBV7703111.1 hypothetical protein [Nocardia nova]MDN2496022.1 hypothetical protein [Nocardia nova]OBA59683.1 hypothetical protein A5780_21250 [Nocardia sp. 852002-20019_SCH5090214]PPI99763.1 hypothetical protein C5E46_05055 [Nocardia nova]